MRVKELLSRLVPGRIREATPETKRAVVRQIISRCPVCGLNFDGHAYAALATVLVADTTAQVELDASMKAGDWARLMALQQWHPKADVIQCDAIQCSRREEVSVYR